MDKLNKSLVYLLIFTMISSALAYRIVVRAYDVLLDTSNYDGSIARTK
jgi:hypothetical protein